jgi:hypothetical protein
MPSEIAKLAVGESVDPAAFDVAFEFLATRGDCVDFTMCPMIRLLYLYGDDPRIPADLKNKMEEAVLDFRHWLFEDDPPMKTDACYWTENHQIAYISIEYLAGQMFPDKTFNLTKKPGAWHMEHARKNLLVWLGIRAKYGFSEWLSPDYYPADLAGLLNLVDFARDPEIAAAARGVADLVLLDIALQCFDGGMRCSSGRSYLPALKNASNASTGPIISMAFDIASTSNERVSEAVVAMATSPSYQPPEAIVAIAHSHPEEVLIHERSGMPPETALEEGFQPEDLEDIFTYWTMQAYTHPRIFLGNLEATRHWNINRFTAESWDAKVQEIERAGGDLSKVSDKSATAMFGPNIETYRTPDYQLSTAQDYRKGKPAFQQQIWLANLGGGASVWTSHPGADDESGRPSYWIGNGFLPRAAQHKNLAILLYRVPEDDPRPFTHVYFPVAEFDEVREENGWVFGRKGSGYIAVTARPEMTPSEREEYSDVERLSKARESMWICRLGREAVDGSFAEFCDRIAKAEIEYQDNRVSFRESPEMTATFGWDEDLVVNGQTIPLEDYPRYAAPYVNTAWGDQVFEITCSGKQHTIDLSKLEVKPFREMS